MTINTILADYSALLGQVDIWYSRCLNRFPSEISCKKGCSDCCRGLFDITLLDAIFLRKGFDQLPDSVKDVVRARAESVMARLRSAWGELSPPYLLNHRPEEDWEELMPDDDETPCVLLGGDGLCLVYGNRPMTCRLHGLPLIDYDGSVLHDEWCSMNFQEVDPVSITELRGGFLGIFRKEVELFRQLEQILLNKGFRELDTFIPLALLVDYENFDWERFTLR